MEEKLDRNSQELANAIKNANPAQFPDFAQVKENLETRSKANVAHTPRQQGPWIVCVSCGNQHTLKWVGVRKKLVGLNEEGGFVLEDRF